MDMTLIPLDTVKIEVEEDVEILWQPHC